MQTNMSKVSNVLAIKEMKDVTAKDIGVVIGAFLVPLVTMTVLTFFIPLPKNPREGNLGSNWYYHWVWETIHMSGAIVSNYQSHINFNYAPTRNQVITWVFMCYFTWHVGQVVLAEWWYPIPLGCFTWGLLPCCLVLYMHSLFFDHPHWPDMKDKFNNAGKPLWIYISHIMAVTVFFVVFIGCVRVEKWKPYQPIFGFLYPVIMFFALKTFKQTVAYLRTCDSQPGFHIIATYFYYAYVKTWKHCFMIAAPEPGMFAIVMCIDSLLFAYQLRATHQNLGKVQPLEDDVPLSDKYVVESEEQTEKDEDKNERSSTPKTTTLSESDTADLKIEFFACDMMTDVGLSFAGYLFLLGFYYSPSTSNFYITAADDGLSADKDKVLIFLLIVTAKDIVHCAIAEYVAKRHHNSSLIMRGVSRLLSFTFPIVVNNFMSLLLAIHFIWELSECDLFNFIL